MELRHNKIFQAHALRRRSMPSLILCLLVAMLCSACYEKEEGCLDHRSKNFDAEADLPCLDCCTYPDMKFTVSHFLGESPFSASNLIRDSINDHLFFISTGLLINNTEFNPNENSFNTINRRNVVLDNGSGNIIQSSVDDFIGVGPLFGGTYVMGQHNYNGEIKDLSFTLGMTPEFNGIQPDSFPTNHHLRDEEKSFYSMDGGDYASAFLQIVFDTLDRDTFTYRVPLADLSAQISLDTQFTIDFGSDISIPLKIDYLQWIEGINFAEKANDDAFIHQKIVENLPKAISINN